MIVSGRNYKRADDACIKPYYFAPPRSPLESLALSSSIKLYTPRPEFVWIDFPRSCWFSTNGCSDISRPPFAGSVDVPAIIKATLGQGIFILCLTLVFVYFKIRRQIRYARESRRRAEGLLTVDISEEKD